MDRGGLRVRRGRFTYNYRRGPVIAVDRPAVSLWLELAACKGEPTGRWYPGRGDRVGLAAAREVCAGCPVQRACLAAALTEERHLPFSYGVRGGLSATERRRLLDASR